MDGHGAVQGGEPQDLLRAVHVGGSQLLVGEDQIDGGPGVVDDVDGAGEPVEVGRREAQPGPGQIAGDHRDAVLAGRVAEAVRIDDRAQSFLGARLIAAAHQTVDGGVGCPQQLPQ